MESLAWWAAELPRTPPRIIPTSIENRNLVVSYSDGEGSNAQIGVAFWTEGRQPIAGVLRVPECVRQLWDHQQCQLRFNDIYEVEAVGPLILLYNFPKVFRNCLWLHFIDNAAA